jgi:His/Glu/Gln/Arg/opine family amino acid ABC transporter permease subunit
MIRPFGWNEFLIIVMAAQWTIALSAIAFAGGGLGGLMIALARVSDIGPLRVVALGFIRVFQGTPLLMQLFLVFFGMNIFGLAINPWIAATIALTLHASAFLGEIWRGCIEAVPPGQREAATALGLHALHRASASRTHRRGTDSRVPGATHQRHIACSHHWVHRTDPAGTDHQQRDLQPVHGLRNCSGNLLHPMLAAFASGAEDGSEVFPRNTALTGPAGGRAGRARKGRKQ